MAPIILVGRREDGAHRDALWDYCSSWWQDNLGWNIYEGHDEEDRAFSLSFAYNLAAAAASDWEQGWEVAVLVGADWLPAEAQQVKDAVNIALDSGQLTIAHNQTCHLHEGATDRLLNGAPLDEVWSMGDWHQNSFSGLVACPRILWDAVGGFDERFVGWGFEDMAFWSACCALGDGFQRVTGIAVHLWHPIIHENREGSLEHAENEPLGRRYIAHKTQREMMLAILHEPGGPLDGS